MTAAPDVAPGVGGTGDAFAKAHATLLADTDIQFTFPAAPKPPEPPAWMEALWEFLKSISPVLEWVFWGVLALVVVTILVFIAREVVRSRWTGRGKPVVLTEGDAWRPTEAQARVLLADADALAAQGRYAEAVHMLLRRSVQDIQTARPRLVKPALTSRDISLHPDLPGQARDAFAAIARIVERSLFGGRGLRETDWTGARSAYTDFALPGVLA